MRKDKEKKTGLKPIKIKQISTMCHIWPKTHTVTTYYTVEVDSDQIALNEEHRDHKWIKEATPDLHPYIQEMIKTADLFKE